MEKQEEYYLNKDACLNPPKYANKSCNTCCYEKKCVYRNKYNYKKINQ